METISILGCGWLGLPLAEHLIHLGYKVKGSTRSVTDISKLESKGIEAHVINLNPDIQGATLESFLESDVLVINFPPERRDDIVEYHRKQAMSLIERIELSSIKKVIFASSTSVYPDLNREVTEEDATAPSKSSGKALLNFEELLNSCGEFKTTVVRFAGLIGPDRNPGRFLSGKKDVKNGDSPVNLIHRDDCIKIIQLIIQKNLWGKVYNACADYHPNRKDYYTKAANNLGIAAPTFIKSEVNSYKIVNSNKLKEQLEYTFLYPDPSEVYM